MPFGLSFGKQKQTTNSSMTGLETTNQSGTTQQAQTETGLSSTTGQTSTSTTGGTRQQQAGTTAQTTTGAETQQGRTSLFSDAVLQALESTGLGALSRVAGAAPVDTSGLEFDSDQFISDAVTRATAAATMSRQNAQGGLYDNIGGTANGNTMAALLDQQLANQEAASIAGARNEATATAAGIERDNLGAELATRQQDQGLMSGILELLRGGQATTEQSATTEQQQRGESESIGAEQQSQQSNQIMQQQQQTTNSLVSLIQQLISGTTATEGTEKSKTKSSGFGLSGGL